MLSIEVAGTAVQLLPQRAAFLPEYDTLLVADAHVGKDASFRRLGVPVPGAATDGTLMRLGAAVAATGARQVVFLGDLLHSVHSHANAPSQAFQRWREAHPTLTLTLVQGNHDLQAGAPPAAWGLSVVGEPWRLGPFALVHHPQAVAGAYALAGHVHPAVLLGGRGRGGAHTRLRLPCFHFGAEVGVLPAFGEFTGSHVLRPAPGERCYVVAGDEVRPLHLAP